MTLKIALKWMAVLGIFLLAAPVNAAETPVLKTQKERVSYGIGVDMARNFKLQGIEFDADILIKGFMDQSSGGKLLMTEDDIRATLNAYQSEIMQKRAQAMKAAAEENKKIGDAFLAENQKKEGVVALPSGLQYKILKAGDGRKPTDADLVECNYRGVLINGTEFDSSYRTGKPVTLKVTGLISGWTEALKLMPVGSKWQLFIPPQLAYGERGAGRYIGPNTTLIFELDLIAIK
ncbi:MAG: FKBP-type peptidyl-prolyl cis-trans isomerase [Syntrophales bacterium]|nr:FKBP-type peptidyl-prolyl cis-trans isomerase [Syntrophales bacterium]